MKASAPHQVAEYELPLPGPAGDAAPQPSVSWSRLPERILARNVRWFCQLRWVVIGVLLAFGLTGAVPALRGVFGLRAPGAWPFVAAGVLAACNAFSLASAAGRLGRWLGAGSSRNLWGQIIMDLVVLTAVVHFLGSVRTHVAFTYLFHIVLACIFFTRVQSLAVTLLAVALLATCLMLEQTGAISSVPLFEDASLMGRSMRAPEVVLALGSTVTIWLAVWYLASHLSVMVHDRDARLVEANRRMRVAQQERARHMLVTTHQLKGPFAAIHANAQILLAGYMGELPPKAAEVVRRIEARCNRLAGEIQEMLQLANLSSVGQDQPEPAQIDLAGMLDAAVEQVEAVARVRGIRFERDLQPATTVGSEDHLKMLLLNLVANAVNYSHDGGEVRLRCGLGDGGEAFIEVADDGIGIAPEKLPRIFEEHYRTQEALKHNSESSGLGLAIVRQVAELYCIRIRVGSRPGEGTSFVLRFRAPEARDTT